MVYSGGGQDSFMDTYFDSQKTQIFKNVEILIFVFDCENFSDKKNFDVFDICLQNIKLYSESAQIFILLHKMDLIHNDKQLFFHKQHKALHDIYYNVFNKTAEKTQADNSLFIYGTSIWDETLYKAWSSIVSQLIPNIQILEHNLYKLISILPNCSELVLFEKTTFLVIKNIVSESNSKMCDKLDSHRFEKISNIIKQFKLNLNKNNSNFFSIKILTQQLYIFILPFTSHTNIMVIINNNPTINDNKQNKNKSQYVIDENAILLNVNSAKQHFQTIFNQ